MPTERRQRRNQRSYSAGYVHGTSPLKHDYEYTEKEYTHAPKPRPKRLSRGKVLYKKVKEEYNLSAVAYFGAVLALIFTFLTLILYFNSETSHTRRELSDLKSTLHSIEEKNVFYETEISKSIDLDLVEKTAKVRLGMSKPDSHQKKYISVPKQSYTTQNKE